MDHRLLSIMRPLWWVASFSLVLSACATEPLPDEVEPPDDEPPLASVLEGKIAEVLRPTDDGRAHYRFQFLAAEGMIAIAAETPLGYPEPLLPRECALDAFARVASDDTIVPDELRLHCGDSSVAEGPRSARELRKPGGELKFQPTTNDLGIAALPSLCTSNGYASRITTLQNLASYRPTIPDCTCNLGAAWNLSGCAWIDGDGDIIEQCSDLDYQFLLQQGASGFYCLPGQTTCEQVPNTACNHTSSVFNDSGGWNSWQRWSVGADLNTETRVDIASCNSTPVTGYWRMRQQSTDAWGAQHPFSVAALATTSLVLTGPISGGDYVGWDFFVRLDGSAFQVASAWVYMEGRDASTCPMNL